ncbi:ferrochelatase [Steroidobacter denitrificans]|uniref:Ferrochelatase n=1 Tax=Steroidobacter denitrificans TaxID=465721 RepID=A0A127F7X3_STEDE|nr:ferrochelatase [Steroidobacter denitrificans]AMN45639.1 ferrochelatase [Steroidobacter denitrificans]
MQDDPGERQSESNLAGTLGILLANLGTPDAPTPAAVRNFLAEFLWDPRVVDAPRWLWWLVLHGIILRIRPVKSARAYRLVWTRQGSPLLLHARALSEALREELSGTQCIAMNSLPELSPAGNITAVIPPHNEDGAPVLALGMSYGSPSIPQALMQLRNAGVRRLIVLPLYPQYSSATTGSVFDRISRELQHWRWIPELRFINNYHDDNAYIDALAMSVLDHWRSHERTHLLFSFHGIPQRHSNAGDPYERQCRETARRVAAQLGLSAADWSVSFQSQVGREAWLRPYTDEFLLLQARTGHKRITVMCPGFAADCLETLEEIAIRNRNAFMQHGGEHYTYIPALNAGKRHALALAGLIRRHAAGWMTS